MKLPRFPRMNGPANLLQSEPLLRPTVLMQSTYGWVPNGFRTVDGWGTPDLWICWFLFSLIFYFYKDLEVGCFVMFLFKMGGWNLWYLYLTTQPRHRSLKHTWTAEKNIELTHLAAHKTLYNLKDKKNTYTSANKTRVWRWWQSLLYMLSSSRTWNAPKSLCLLSWAPLLSHPLLGLSAQAFLAFGQPARDNVHIKDTDHLQIKKKSFQTFSGHPTLTPSEASTKTSPDFQQWNLKMMGPRESMFNNCETLGGRHLQAKNHDLSDPCPEPALAVDAAIHPSPIETHHWWIPWILVRWKWIIEIHSDLKHPMTLRCLECIS